MHLMLATVAEWKSVYGNRVRGNLPSFPSHRAFSRWKLAGPVFVYFYELALHPDEVLGTRPCLSCLPNPCKQVKNVVKQTTVQSVWCILFWGLQMEWGLQSKLPNLNSSQLLQNCVAIAFNSQTSQTFLREH